MARAMFSPAVPWVTLANAVNVLPADAGRNYLLIENASSGNIWVNFTALAQVGNGLKIPAGGNYEPWVVPTNSIWVMGDTVGLAFYVVSG